MAIAPGARLGPYEILAAIGSGGMGEVYRARDTRLKREIAIKVLPQHVTSRDGKRQRFEREAQAVAALSHPHICALFDVGSQDGIEFLVMEHLEGETLERRLVRGALPLHQVLRHAIEIADALDHAHRHRIVHRDLKPTNIMLTKAGAKLLDFGLAKWSQQEPVQLETQNLTTEGAIVGTLQYMAPEQIEGKEVDARTDLFAFGAIVYEMVTGRKAFSSGSHAGLIAAILTADPAPLGTLAPTTPPALERIVKKCVAKDPEARWQTARDLLDELKWMVESGGFGAATRRSRKRLAWLGAAAVVAAAITVGTVSVRSIRSRSLPTEERAFRFTVAPPDDSNFDGPSTYVVLSPDGRTLVFGASSKTGDTALWMRSLDSPVVRRILGSDRALQPFWSPDSRSLGFLLYSAKSTNGVVARALKRIDPSGGVATDLIDVREAWMATWNGSDVVFMPGPNVSGGLYRASAGRAPEPVTTLDQSRGETGHWYPHFLPDGRHFLYLARSRQPEHNNIVHVGSIDSRTPVRLFAADSHVEYASGFLLYITSLRYMGKLSGGPLVARPFDPTTLRVTGDAIRVAGPVDRSTDYNRGSFSVSQTGVLAFRPLADMALVWFDRAGKPLQSIGSGMNPSLSPDGQRLAVARVDAESGASNIWLMDISGANAARLTSGGFSYDMPLWSPDGTRVLFKADRGQGPGIHQKASDGSGSEEALLAPAQPADSTIMPLAWSEDGRSLVYGRQGSTTSYDLAMLPVTGDRKPVSLFEQPVGEFLGTTSSNGRWIAYVAADSKQTDVFVRPFPFGEGKWKISTEGGTEPAWRRDGKELFYLGSDGSLMSVAVNGDSKFYAGAAKRLFQTKLVTGSALSVNRNQYVVSADGQRFLIREVPDGWNDWKLMPITVVVNWPAALKH